METRKHTYILYLILFTIMATISIQVYWNLGNYRTNKQALINEVQNSFDSSVDTYYANLTKTDFFTLLVKDTLNFGKNYKSVSIQQGDSIINLDMRPEGGKTAVEKMFKSVDSGKIIIRPRGSIGRFSKMRFFGEKMRDSSRAFRKLFNRLISSTSLQRLDLKKLDSLLYQDLNQKEIDLSYQLNYFEDDSLLNTISKGKAKKYSLATVSKSNYVVGYQKFELNYNNPVFTVLKKSLTGIVLSLLLSGCVVFSLFYLLGIIKKQKQLSEIKNDLISNITHEFKTPIATVSTAIEGIKNFDGRNDWNKTEKYLDISNQQLQKLHQMVEKLLETATLDSDKLIINKEEVDIVALINQLVEKYRMLASQKDFLFSTNVSELHKEVDVFHFENALANLIDNAIKYGGEKIEVNINSLMESVQITVADNGGPIEPSQREKIFEKFYRIPTGNRHDVKGFGIGLFYSKKIMEKHGARLNLIPDPSYTIFRIEL